MIFLLIRSRISLSSLKTARRCVRVRVVAKRHHAGLKHKLAVKYSFISLLKHKHVAGANVNVNFESRKGEYVVCPHLERAILLLTTNHAIHRRFHFVFGFRSVAPATVVRPKSKCGDQRTLADPDGQSERGRSRLGRLQSEARLGSQKTATEEGRYCRYFLR